MKLLIDTNIVLDILLKRDSFFEDAKQLFLQIDNFNTKGYISASAVTDIFYIASKNLKNKQKAKDLLKKLLQIVNVLTVSEEEIHMALQDDWEDFEDSVQFSVASMNEIDYIITRNEKDFSKSSITAMTPKAFLLNKGIIHD